MLFSMLLSLLMCVVGASKASAGNDVPRNPIVRIDNGPTYSDNGTEVTLKLWMYNYDGDNAWFIGDVYLTIDGVKVCKLNVNPAKRNVLDLKNETCKNREKRNVLKISHTRHFKTTKKQSKTGCFYSF